METAWLQFDEYEGVAMTTLNPRVRAGGELLMLNNAALGLAGEGGEIADRIKKVLFQDHPFTDDDRSYIVKELGDVLWYVAEACFAMGIPMSLVVKINAAKLRNRYKSGTFTAEESIHRQSTSEGEPETDASAWLKVSGVETGRFSTKKPNIEEVSREDPRNPRD